MRPNLNLKQTWPHLTIIAMLLWLVLQLSIQLKASRANEAELSRINYQLIRGERKSP